MSGLVLARGLPASSAALGELHARGRVGFVPTMGALHAGHLSLVRRARELADVVAVSIFVNPLQFGAGEDLGRYPRDLEGDAAKLEEAGADLCFTFEPEEVYPPGHCTHVTVTGPLTEGLEGASRSGHFRGVTTIVDRLFRLAAPEVAVFGQKDLQQALVLRRMVRDLGMPLRLVVAPTVRDPDGLALSSRNAYLSPAERELGLSLSRGLGRALDALEAGERGAACLRQLVRSAAPEEDDAFAWDYVEVAGLGDLVPVRGETATPLAILCTARVGPTRLLDNLVFPFGILDRLP